FQRINLGVSVNESTIAASSLDKFSRLPTADPGNRLDVEFIYDLQADLIDEIVAGNGTATHNANSRDVSLRNVATGTGDSAALASYPVPYTPGNSQLVEITGALNAANISGGSAEVFLRSKITGAVVDQVFNQVAGEWNGVDVSTVDWSKSHIFEMDFQSLKVGIVSYYLNRAGKRVNVHNIYNDNIRTSGYWQSPTLPV
ncbi:MAG: hypothetical protein KAU20_00015, partial [Nanoarchaeota archaeon]|nr:hypothetical protein [Nanoarchaeota archaeon]